MYPLQRKMFANGDEVVLERVSSKSQINPKEYVFTLEEIDGKPVAVKTQVTGLQEEEPEVFPIDLRLSPTGDPREAFARQRSNQLFSNIQTGGIALSTLPLTQTRTAGSILTGLGGLGIKYGPKVASFINKTLNPFKTRLKSPVAVPGTQGFPARNPLNPFSYQTAGMNPSGTIIGSGGALYGGTEAGTITLEDAQKEKDEIATELAILAKNRTEYKDTAKESIELAIKVAIAEGDTEQVELLQQELVKYEDKGPQKPEVAGKDSEATIEEIDPESLAKKRTLAESIEKFGSETPKEPREKRETPFLQNKNFLDLMRNIGIQMVETGDIGMGISQGSAETLKEQRATELRSEAKESELEKIAYEYGFDLSNAVDLEKAKSIYKRMEGPDITDITKINTLEQEYITNYQAAENKKYTAVQIKEALNTLTTKGNSIFGVGNIISSNIDKIMEFVAGDSSLNAENVKEGLKFENPREYVKTILEIVQNKNIKELLGESGRTISNLDRQVVEKIIGQLKDTSILSQSPKAIATKLELLYESLIREAQENMDKAGVSANNLKMIGRNPETLITAPSKVEQRRVRLQMSVEWFTK